MQRRIPAASRLRAQSCDDLERRRTCIAKSRPRTMVRGPERLPPPPPPSPELATPGAPASTHPRSFSLHFRFESRFEPARTCIRARVHRARRRTRRPNAPRVRTSRRHPRHSECWPPRGRGRSGRVFSANTQHPPLYNGVRGLDSFFFTRSHPFVETLSSAANGWGRLARRVRFPSTRRSCIAAGPPGSQGSRAGAVARSGGIRQPQAPQPRPGGAPDAAGPA